MKEDAARALMRGHVILSKRHRGWAILS